MGTSNDAPKEKENRNNDNTKNPYFIIHVGPPKTATTSIQCGLEAYAQKLATEDGYYFIGKRCPPVETPTMENGEVGIQGHHLIMGIIYNNPTSRGVEQLQERMKVHHAKGESMILSLEAMSNHFDDKPEVWELFYQILEGWNVVVVVGYRHYFDWIKSMYYQQHIGPKFKDKWPGPKRSDGYELPTFEAFFKHHMEHFESNDITNDGHSYGQHLSLYAYEYFASHFEQTYLFNLHQQHTHPGNNNNNPNSSDKDVVTDFICQMLPTAHQTCQYLQKQQQQQKELDEPLLAQSSSNTTTATKIIKRASQSFDADLLAQTAVLEMKLMDPAHMSRNALIRKVEHRLQEVEVNQTYKSCLSPSLLERFWNMSLRFEQRVFQAQEDHFQTLPFQAIDHQGPVDQHQTLFQRAVAGFKFCEINAHKVLEADAGGWKTWFLELPKSKNNDKNKQKEKNNNDTKQ